MFSQREKTKEFSYKLWQRLYRQAQKPSSEVLRALKSSSEGLTSEQVLQRREIYGPNEVADGSKSASYKFLIKAFKNPFNYLICTLAVVSYITDDLRAALVMASMVVLSVTLTFFQELRSSRAAEKLSAMIETNVTVIRKPENESSATPGRNRQEIPLADLVPGDIIQLSAGDLIPADVRVISAKTLMVNQSAITGETMPVEKDAEPETFIVPNKSLPDLRNICIMGSSIASGVATAVVLHTGRRTYLGSIAKTILRSRPETDFDRGIQRFTKLMIKFMVVMVPLVFLINGITKGNWSEAFLFAIAVAVGLTPEMLPMIVTVNLAKGAMTMSKKKVIVKRLGSIQNFGAMDILCTDKTGTLTEDLLVFGNAIDTKGDPSPQVLHFAYLNSLFQTGLKNFLDLALIKFVDDNNLTAAQDFILLDELPFDFSRKQMSVLVENTDGQRHLITKGAPEEIISHCTSTIDNDNSQVITAEDRARHLSFAKGLADQGFRVIAVASKEFPSTKNSCELSDETELSFMGYIVFLDPPVKESAAIAIQALAKYGVAVKILTGDNERVTVSVAKKVGLDSEHILFGHQMTSMSDAELQVAVQASTIFAKLTPDQKEKIIRALQQAGHVVGFIGDGINDAPALRVSDVGISVNNAVDIAKESADIILLEKNLLVLEEGVVEGRKVFGNIEKYIKMGASSNFGNVFSMLGASCLLPFLPMLPVQMLTQNLLYDFSQAGIPFDRVDEEYLLKPRKWEIADIQKFMIFFGPVSSLFDYITFAVLWFYFKANSVESQAFFQSGWFIEGLLSQTLIVHIIRTRQIPFIQSRASGTLLLTTAIIMAIGVYLPFSRFGASLGFVKMPLAYFPWLIVILISYCALAHSVKSWFIKKYS